MNRIRLKIRLTSDTPEAAAELLRSLAVEVERKIYPDGIKWHLHHGPVFDADLETPKFGDADATVEVINTKSKHLSVAFEFVDGAPTLPFWESFHIRIVSIVEGHTIVDVSPEPGRDTWFLFQWENPIQGFITDGEIWLLVVESGDNCSGMAWPKLEVTFDVGMGDYLTVGDQVLIKEHIKKHVDKLLE